jgi:hypothetical protein
MFIICSMINSISELIRLRNSFVVLSCYCYAQKHSQYVPLKVACIDKEYMILLNIMSFRHLHMVQHNAAIVTPHVSNPHDSVDHMFKKH